MPGDICTNCGIDLLICDCVECSCRAIVRQTAICTNCHNCNNCCRCITCQRCTKVVNNYCGGCLLCDTCCKCHTVPQYSGLCIRRDGPLKIKFIEEADRTETEQSRRFPLLTDRFLAAEIEVAQSNHKAAELITNSIDKWGGHTVYDGSLPASGYEINTAPAKKAAFKQQIIDICETIKANGGIVTNTCGLHVHVDCRSDGTPIVLKNIIRSYAKVEHALFSIINPIRKRSRFCRPCGDTYHSVLILGKNVKDFQNKLIDKLYGDHNGFKEALRTKRHDIRYYALNLHSLYFRGTLEFRHYHGTIEPAEIINWTNICSAIVDFSKNNSDQEIEKQLKDLTPIDALKLMVRRDQLSCEWIDSQIKRYSTPPQQ